MSRFSKPLSMLLALPLAAVVWLGSRPEEPPDFRGATERKIADAVERLASPDRATRLAAERELIDEGPWILRHLPEAGSVVEPAARAALARIRNSLETAKATLSVRPSLVTVTTSGPAGDVAAYLTAATRSAVLFTPEQSERPVAAAFEDRPWWEAVDHITREIGVWPSETDSLGRLTFRERTSADESKRIGYDGAFRIAAGPVSLRAIAGDKSRQLIRVPLELRSEPKLRPLFASFAADSLKLIPAGGEAIASFTPGAKYELPFSDRFAELRLDFVAPAPAPKAPQRLTGKLEITVAAGEEWFVGVFEPTEAGDGLRPVRREERRGGVTVRFHDAKRNDDGTVEVAIAVVYDRGGPAFESHRTWVYHNVAYLEYRVRRDGVRRTHRVNHEPGFATLAQSDGGVMLRYRFAGLPDEALHFIYKAPTNIVTVPVMVDIDGLTLPDISAESDAVP